MSKAAKVSERIRLMILKLSANHSLGDQRHAWIQLIEGDLELNGERLTSGDGAAVDDETELKLASKKGAHFLLFDLN